MAKQVPFQQAISRSYDDDLKGLRAIPHVGSRTLRTGQDTITSTVTGIRDFLNFEDGPPADADLLRFQVVSGGPIHVSPYDAPTAAGTSGSFQFLAGDFFEVDGPDMETIQFVLATGGASADVRVAAVKREA